MIDITLLKERVNCVEVASQILSLPIRKAGDRCASPLRQGAKNKTSFVVNNDFFFDFGSGTGGDCIDLLAAVKYGGARGDAIKELAAYTNMEDSFDYANWTKKTVELKANLSRWHEELPDSFREYLKNRRIKDETIEALKIGRSDDGRLSIPYFKNGQAVYYTTRFMPGGLYPQQKYKKMLSYDRQSNEKLDYCDNVVWGLDSLSRGGETLIIAEGAFDVISFWQENYPCISAMTGCFSHSQLPTVISAARLFKRVLITYDNDPVSHAGQNFTIKMGRLLLAHKIPFVVGKVPSQYKDVSEFYADGGDLKFIIDNAVNGINFLGMQLLKERDFEKFARDTCRFMATTDVVKLFDAVRVNGFSAEWLKALAAECKKPPSEDYVAKAVLKKHKLKYNRKIGFFCYNGKFWQETGEEKVQSFIADELGVHRTGNKLTSILKVVKSAVVTEEIFNTAPVINFSNGTLEIEPCIKFRDHNENDNLTYCLDYPYNTDLKCDAWERFLNEITDYDGRKVDLFQEACGYTLFTDNKFQTAFFLIGTGSNGKSVFLEVLSKLFGKENVTNIEMSALAQDFQRVQLSSSILNISTETRSDVNGAESYFKQIVAGDTVSACYKGKPYFSFVPRAKLWISCNEFIKPKDTTDGFLRRLKFINFPMRFCENPQKENERPIDRELVKKLTERKSLSGIFNWVLKGYIALKEIGRFSEPSDEITTKEEFKELINPVIGFVKTYTLPNPAYGVSNETIYMDYKTWCDDNGHSRPLAKRRFQGQFAKYVSEYRRDLETYRTNAERGYKIKTEESENE